MPRKARLDAPGALQHIIMRGDERILGQGNFVETVFKAAQENLDRKSRIRAQGCDFDRLVDRVLGLFDLTSKELLTGGKQRRTVQARSVLCYWREAGTWDEHGEDIEEVEHRVLDGQRIREEGPANRRIGRVEAFG